MEGVRNINEAVNGGRKIKAHLIREGKLSDWARGLVHTTAVKNYRLREAVRESFFWWCLTDLPTRGI